MQDILSVNCVMENANLLNNDLLINVILKCLKIIYLLFIYKLFGLYFILLNSSTLTTIIALNVCIQNYI